MTGQKNLPHFKFFCNAVAVSHLAELRFLMNCHFVFWSERFQVICDFLKDFEVEIALTGAHCVFIRVIFFTHRKYYHCNFKKLQYNSKRILIFFYLKSHFLWNFICSTQSNINIKKILNFH